MDKRASKSRVPAADGTPSVCSLPLGRLFEGHVNALEFVLRYGPALPDKDEGGVTAQIRAVALRAPLPDATRKASVACVAPPLGFADQGDTDQGDTDRLTPLAWVSFILDPG